MGSGRGTGVKAERGMLGGTVPGDVARIEVVSGLRTAKRPALRPGVVTGDRRYWTVMKVLVTLASMGQGE